MDINNNEIEVESREEISHESNDVVVASTSNTQDDKIGMGNLINFTLFK